jgi:hypothetical protein
MSRNIPTILRILHFIATSSGKRLVFSNCLVDSLHPRRMSGFALQSASAAKLLPEEAAAANSLFLAPLLPTYLPGIVRRSFRTVASTLRGWRTPVAVCEKRAGNGEWI